jgi:uncharacterized protein
MNRVPGEFVVDGYNLIHKLFPAPTTASLEFLRQETEKKLLLFQRDNKCSVTIVYDGKGSPWESSVVMPLHIVFTPASKSADEWIIDYVKSLNTNLKKVTIVSSDDEIRRYSAAFGAKCIKSELLAAQLKNNRTSVSLLGGTRRTGLSSVNEKKFEGEPLSDREVDQWAQLFARGRS